MFFFDTTYLMIFGDLFYIGNFPKISQFFWKNHGKTMNFGENPGFWDDFWQDFKKVVKFSENPLYKINHQDLWYQKKTFLYDAPKNLCCEKICFMFKIAN